MKKIVFAVMAFALFAGLTSCDKKGSMEELTIETSLTSGDSIAQFKCTFTPTVSNGYFVFYTKEKMPADQQDVVFEEFYGKYETYKESKTLYTFWLEPGHTYYLYAMTFKEKDGKATLTDVKEVMFSTPPSNAETQDLWVEWWYPEDDKRLMSIKVPTEYDNTYCATWTHRFSGTNKDYDATIKMSYQETCAREDVSMVTSNPLWINDNHRFEFTIDLTQINMSSSYSIKAINPTDQGDCDVFDITVSLQPVSKTYGSGSVVEGELATYETIQYESPISPILPGKGPIAF